MKGVRNTADLATRLSYRTGVDAETCAKIVDALGPAIRDLVANEIDCSIPLLGKFTLRQRREKKMISNLNGKEVVIPGALMISFKMARRRAKLTQDGGKDGEEG